MLLDVRSAAGKCHRIPEWMTQLHICQSMTLTERPQCSVAALHAVRAQLDAWARSGSRVAGNNDVDIQLDI